MQPQVTLPRYFVASRTSVKNKSKVLTTVPWQGYLSFRMSFIMFSCFLRTLHRLENTCFRSKHPSCSTELRVYCFEISIGTWIATGVQPLAPARALAYFPQRRLGALRCALSASSPAIQLWSERRVLPNLSALSARVPCCPAAHNIKPGAPRDYTHPTRLPVSH